MAHVLIAVSDAEVRAVIGEVVSEAGHTVTEAGTLTVALDALMASEQLYIVLLDTYLDGNYTMSGLLLEMAYEGFLYRHIFVLLSTNGVFRLPPSLQVLRGKLALAVVSMPFDVDDLLHAVERAAEQSQSGSGESGRKAVSPPSSDGRLLRWPRER